MKITARRLPAAMALVCVFGLVSLAGCSKQQPAAVPDRAVRTLLVSDTGGVIEREFSAEIRARTESHLSFRVPGKVARRLVELGQPVRAGTVLGQLDPQDLRLQQDAARAGLAAAEANALQAAADLKRFTDLRAQGFISEAELERHATMAKTAEASLKQARAQAGVQSNQASYAALLADAAGVITSVDMEPGQVVNAGMPVLTLAHDGPRDAVFAVPEDMGPAVRALIGKREAIKVRRWGSAEWLPASVREVAAAADPVTRTILAKADVGQGSFELGQSASVAFNTPVRVSAGVRVPLYALAEKDGKTIVWVLDPKRMTVSPQPVITADVTGNVVLVARGLQPGQEIVTAGTHVLQPGQKVRRYQSTASDQAASAATQPTSQH